MIISIGTDKKTKIIEQLISELKKRGHEVIYFGPKNKESSNWTETTSKVIKLILSNKSDEGIVLCSTGTGASIAANKFNGIRAALCNDAETTKGTRKWNHANVLALSLNTLNFKKLNEILDAWFSTPYIKDKWNKSQIQNLKEIELNN